MRCKLPTYEYECNECRAKFEKRQSFHDDPISSCPKCEGIARRVIHSVPILFKGSGFYCTDNGRGSAATANRKQDDGESETSTATKTEDKVDTQAEAKVESKSSSTTEDSG